MFVVTTIRKFLRNLLSHFTICFSQPHVLFSLVTKQTAKKSPNAERDERQNSRGPESRVLRLVDRVRVVRWHTLNAPFMRGSRSHCRFELHWRAHSRQTWPRETQLSGPRQPAGTWEQRWQRFSALALFRLPSLPLQSPPLRKTTSQPAQRAHCRSWRA